jgi:hypothetical protein
MPRSLLLIGALLAACGGPRLAAPADSGSQTNENDNDAGGVDAGTLAHDSAELKIGDSTYRWSGMRGNLILCEGGTKYLFVRLALATVRDGEDDLHLDLDVCNYQGFGHFDGNVANCNPEDRFFDVVWHTRSDVHLNNAASTPCTLDLAHDGGSLDGTFHCNGLGVPPNHPGTLNVEGSFRCDYPSVR